MWKEAIVGSAQKIPKDAEDTAKKTKRGFQINQNHVVSNKLQFVETKSTPDIIKEFEATLDKVKKVETLHNGFNNSNGQKGRISKMDTAPFHRSRVS